MDINQELARASQAERILTDPLFVEMRANLEADLAAARRAVPLGDSAMHTKLIMLEQIAGKFFGYFELTAQTGKMARMHIADMEKQREGLRDRFKLFSTIGRNAF